MEWRAATFGRQIRKTRSPRLNAANAIREKFMNSGKVVAGKNVQIRNIEEVVLAVEDIDETVKLYEDLFGIKFDAEWEVPMDDMIVKSARIGETQFQVVKSTTPDGLIARFIQT